MCSPSSVHLMQIDIFISWVNSTYRVRVNDVTLVFDAPFNGSAVRRLGLYMFHAGVAWFDEIYAGPDETMGFECPESVKPGEAVKMWRPIQSGWSLQEMGKPTAYWEITRHESHLSQREMYTLPGHAGLVYNDGAPHILFRSDIKTKRNDGDHVRVHGKVHAGAMMLVPGDGTDPPQDLVERATTTNNEEGVWSSGLNDIVANGQTGRYHWFGEHDSRGVGPEEFIGGVGSCSSNDMINWRNEGIMFHFSNITDNVFNSSAKLRAERPKVRLVTFLPSSWFG